MIACPHFTLNLDDTMKCGLVPFFIAIAGPGSTNYPCPKCWIESNGSPTLGTPTIQKLLSHVPVDEFGERVNPRGDCKGCGG